MELAHALDYPGCLLRDEADDGVDGQGARALKVCLVAGAGAEAAAGGLGMARGGVEAARGGGGRCCPCGLLGGEDEGCGEGGGAGGGQALSYYGREGPCCGCESHGGGCGWLWSWCCRGEGEEGERGGAHDRLRWKLQGAQSRRQPGQPGSSVAFFFSGRRSAGQGLGVQQQGQWASVGRTWHRSIIFFSSTPNLFPALVQDATSKVGPLCLVLVSLLCYNNVILSQVSFSNKKCC